MKITGAVIHCSDSPQNRGDNAETIHRWHKERGFDGIGYHYVILEDGAVEVGRPHYWTGAHAKGRNQYIGICLIGQGEYTKEQFNSLKKLLSKLVKEKVIHPYKIIAHSAISDKKCPMFDVQAFMVEWMAEELDE